jgi:class 3 adenylate cyclase/tetratricopeptide (TPR) repeat protein
MVVCPSCGSENRPDARFCGRCGASIGEACPRCGADRPSDARFCSSCGLEFAPAATGEERKLVSVLFADVTGSTELGERLDAERLREVMDSFFAAMRTEIEAEGGTVEKFIGDAVMAAFGVPAAHEDDPARAVRAALRMRRRLDSLNQELTQAHGVALAMRVGVNTGEVLAVTAPRPGEAMVTGDAVNVAARLEQVAEPGQILVGERTARAARGFRFRDAGPVELRGKAEPARAFLVLQPEEVDAEVPAAPERGIPGIRAPLVGRDSELDVLTSLYDRVATEGRPHLVTISGDPGVGKSRLTAEFLGTVEGRSPAPTIVRGRCLPYGEGVTYWPLAEILKVMAGVLDTDPPDLVLEKIQKVGKDLVTSDLAPDPKRAIAALAYTVGVAVPGFSFAEMAPRQVRLETHSAWRSFFTALAKRSPLLVVVEDIHWADPALLDLLEETADRVEGPVLFVCPARPELTDRRPDWGGGKRNYSSLFLDPLTSEDSDRLVGLLLAVEDLPESLRRRILERAEGNPFFLEEIIRQLIDAGGIVREGDRWRAKPGVEDVAIPDTIQGVLAARIDLLVPEEKRALQAAAVVGRVFWTGAVGVVVDGQGPPEAVDELLERVERRELVLSRLSSAVSGQREYIFKHILTRDVTYESLPRRDRAEAHARVARWMESTVGERRMEFVELLAHHFVEAYRGAAEGPRVLQTQEATSGRKGTTVDAVEELRSKAFAYLLLASEDARRKFVLTKAQRLAEQALGLAGETIERAGALEALGAAYQIDYRGDLGWKYFTEAIDARLEGVPGDRESIAQLCARAVEVPTRWPGSMTHVPSEEEATRYLSVGFEHAGEKDSPTLVGMLTARAFWPFAFLRDRPFSREELASAIESGERAADMALRLKRPPLASAALDGVASAFAAQGLTGKAAAVNERRVALSPEVGDPWELGDIHGSAAWILVYLGRYREALNLSTEGLDIVPADVASMRLHCQAWRALARFRLGDWDGFFVDLAQVQEMLGERSAEPPYFAARPFATAAFVHEIQGNRTASDRFIALVATIDEIQGEARATERDPWIAWTLARRGAFEEARARLWNPLVESWRVALPIVMEARSDLLGDMEAWDEVPEFLAGARAYAEEAGLVALPFFADRLEGRAAIAAQRRLVAENLLTRASDGFASLEAPWEEARTRLFLAEALLSARRIAEAREELEKARPVFQRLSSARELVRSRELLAGEGLTL